jgi:hypothetical protein
VSIEDAHRHGYDFPRDIDGVTCGLRRLMYTVGVFYNITDGGTSGRICFDTAMNAVLFLAEWDGITLPTVGEDGCKAIKLGPSFPGAARQDSNLSQACQPE